MVCLVRVTLVMRKVDRSLLEATVGQFFMVYKFAMI